MVLVKLTIAYPSNTLLLEGQTVFPTDVVDGSCRQDTRSVAHDRPGRHVQSAVGSSSMVHKLCGRLCCLSLKWFMRYTTDTQQNSLVLGRGWIFIVGNVDERAGRCVVLKAPWTLPAPANID